MGSRDDDAVRVAARLAGGASWAAGGRAGQRVKACRQAGSMRCLQLHGGATAAARRAAAAAAKRLAQHSAGGEVGRGAAAAWAGVGRRGGKTAITHTPWQHDPAPLAGTQGNAHSKRIPAAQIAMQLLLLAVVFATRACSRSLRAARRGSSSLRPAASTHLSLLPIVTLTLRLTACALPPCCREP